MEIGKEIEAISRSLRRRRSQYMEALGLKGVQAQLLLVIGENPDISQDALAQKAGVDKSNIARQVAVLEEMGYVQRQPAPGNRRMLRLHLTNKALMLLPKLQKTSQNWEEDLLQDLSNWEISQLSAFLRRIRQSIDGPDGAENVGTRC